MQVYLLVFSNYKYMHLFLKYTKFFRENFFGFRYYFRLKGYPPLKKRIFPEKFYTRIRPHIPIKKQGGERGQGLT